MKTDILVFEVDFILTLAISMNCAYGDSIDEIAVLIRFCLIFKASKLKIFHEEKNQKLSIPFLFTITALPIVGFTL